MHASMSLKWMTTPVPSAISKKAYDDFTSGNTCVFTTENDINIMLLRPSSSAGPYQGEFVLTDGEAALNHVLFKVLANLGVGHLSNHGRGVGSMRFKMFF